LKAEGLRKIKVKSFKVKSMKVKVNSRSNMVKTMDIYSNNKNCSELHVFLFENRV
jgi:hypothetical protein